MTSGISNIGAEGSISRHLREIWRQPVLSFNEEVTLARRWRDCQDIGAGHRLVTSHLRLTAKIAMGYRGYGLPLGELISEGNVGLIQAVKRFDPDRGFRLATYAMYWVRAAIQAYVLRSWSLVKMGTTAAQKKLFFNLRRQKTQMPAIEGGDLRPEQVTKIAQTLKVPEPDVISMSYRLSAPDHSLSAPVHTDGGSEWLDLLADEHDSQETILVEREELNGRQAPLHNALKSLNRRERHILTARRLSDNPATLLELGRQYGISRERVRQIEDRAIQKLRHVMNVPRAD